VATKRPNELGFYDMSGNVSEVVQDDWYNYTVQPRVNPNLWQGQWDNVARGGDYRSLVAEVRVTQRQKHSNAPAIGFRIMIQ
jgi:formylglycine-generating enzyme required for sulfatase activity